MLSDQDAVDIAEYFTHQPRPDFPGKVNDWPHGDQPKDARYCPLHIRNKRPGYLKSFQVA